MEVLSKKAEKVFGEALPLVTAEAEKNANQIGLTVSQYTDMSAAIGDLLIPMGFQRTEAAAISTQLVNLSGALSEWSGGVKTSTEVNQILSKALLGEREGLKQLGISIQEADVKARLADKGLDKLTGTMLQQAKAAATLELILEKSADAQDAYAQNSDTLVRKQAEINAKFGEIKDTLTAALIPVFSRLVKAAVPMVDILSKSIKTLVDGEEPTGRYAKATKALSLIILGLMNNFTLMVAAGKVIIEDIFTPLWEMIERRLSPAFRLFSRITGNNAKTTFSLGEVFNFLTKAIRFTLKPLTLVLDLLNTLDRKVLPFVINGIQFLSVKFGEFNNITIGLINSLSSLIGIDPLPKINVDEVSNLFEGLGESAGKSFEKGLDKTNTIPSAAAPTFEGSKNLAINDASNGIDQKAIDKAKKQAEREAEAKAKVQEKANRERLKKIEEFNAEIKKLEDEQLLNSLSDKQRALEENKQYYNSLVEQARELFGKQSEQEEALENQRQDRVLEIENEFALKREEARAEIAERKKEKLQEQLEEEAELLTEIEIENLEEKIIRLDDEFILLLEKAELHELDKTAITKKYNDERIRIEKEAAKQKLKNEKTLEEGRLKLQKARLNNISSGVAALSQLAGENASIQKGLFLVEKGVATADVIINLQKEIAKNSALYSGIPGGAAIAAGLNVAAKIRAAISLATIAGTTIAGFAKEEGGYVDATGPNGGKKYKAQYTERPQAGFLPPGPQLILANEKGAEYFIPNHLLTHPAVADQVAIIEAIRTGSQMENGGFTTNRPSEITPNNTSIQIDNRKTNELIESNMIIMNSLLERIDAGLYVLVDEDDASDIDELITRTKEKEG